MGGITIKRNGRTQENYRPSWIHGRPDGQDYPGNESASLEMLESIRNMLEKLNNSQMLQCDVAHAIKGMAQEAIKTRQLLARIDRRLAQVEKLR